MMHVLVFREDIKKFLFLLLLIIPFNGIFTQQPALTYSFLNFGVNQGLPSSEVYDLYQDPQSGVIWIATDRGLVAYDGYNFTTYTMDDGLTDNVVLRLSPDQWDNIWLHTLNNQLCYLDRERNIQQFKYNDALQK